jgi:phosphate transport system ATP-binding protein
MPTEDPSPIILETRDLSVAYGENRALGGVTLSVPSRRVTAFIGPSGCGKTYLTETAGRVCQIPYCSMAATDITCEGYVGLSVDDALKGLLRAGNVLCARPGPGKAANARGSIGGGGPCAAARRCPAPKA